MAINIRCNLCKEERSYNSLTEANAWACTDYMYDFGDVCRDCSKKIDILRVKFKKELVTTQRNKLVELFIKEYGIGDV